MNIWQTLDIEKTNDLQIIRQAYAKKIKICKPEKDAQGFQNVRMAYELAQKYAAGLQINDEVNVPQSNASTSSPPKDKNPNPSEAAITLANILYQDTEKAYEYFDKLVKKGAFGNFDFSETFQNILSINLLTAMPKHQRFIIAMIDYFNWHEPSSQRKNTFYGAAISSLLIQTRPFRFLQHLHFLTAIKNKKQAKEKKQEWNKCRAAKVLLGPPKNLRFYITTVFFRKKKIAVLTLLKEIETSFPEVIGVAFSLPTLVWWQKFRRESNIIRNVILFIFFGISWIMLAAMIDNLTQVDTTNQRAATITNYNSVTAHIPEPKIDFSKIL